MNVTKTGSLSGAKGEIEKPGRLSRDWIAPEIPDPNAIPKGDMPGDKIDIGQQHLAKAQVVFPRLLDLLEPILASQVGSRAVVAVHGGSGVGKSETGALLAYYLNRMGIGAYILSGDNYPHRIPKDNDRERLRVFREHGVKGLVAAGQFSKERNLLLQHLQDQDQDANPAHCQEHPWLAAYQAAGIRGLEAYLGTLREIDFDELNQIINQFKAGAPVLMLKRMGREAKELWYDQVDFSETRVLIIEWTHGNNDNLLGVDIPILLNSIPQETLEHRRSRNRDGALDSPFTTMVLAIEQRLLVSQAAKAKLIVSKDGGIISYDSFRALMPEKQGGGR